MFYRWVGLVVLFLAGIVPSSQAATLYMEPQGAAINRGDTITIPIRLDTEDDECVNVIDGVIHYSANIEPVDTSRGNSIVSVWVEDPVINKAERTISFAGGIPNGYCGRIPGDPRLTNIVLELLFRSPGMVVGQVDESDQAEITFGAQTQALLNDGFGTEAPLNAYGTTVTLLKQVGSSINNEWSDRVAADEQPPNEFTIKLQRTPNAFSNKFYIVFNTTDKQSGIDHYEVIEEPLEDLPLFRWGAATAPWVEVRSPYVLKDQSLNSVVRVKAVDKAGNEYIASLIPEESDRSLSTQGKIILALIATILIFFVIAGIVVSVWYRRRQIPAKAFTESSQDMDHEQIGNNET